jgi:hypothetical protein
LEQQLRELCLRSRRPCQAVAFNANVLAVSSARWFRRHRHAVSGRDAKHRAQRGSGQRWLLRRRRLLLWRRRPLLLLLLLLLLLHTAGCSARAGTGSASGAASVREKVLGVAGGGSVLH